MSKKQTETGAPPTLIKKKYLNPAQCRDTAARISAEMKEDREGREKWGDQWAAYLYPPGTPATGENGAYLGKRGPKPLTLIWPGDLPGKILPDMAGRMLPDDPTTGTLEAGYHPGSVADPRD